MFQQSQVKLMDRLVRDAQGNPTGAIRSRPVFDVMIDPIVLTEEMEPYLHTPQYIDDCWAGQETLYLRFNTEAQARAIMAKWLTT
jgi:hypothetical protein